MNLSIDHKKPGYALASAAVLLGSMVVFAYFNQYIALAVPFVCIFIALLVLNFRLGYWIFLFTIPASVQLTFLGDTLSTSLPDEPMMALWLVTLIALLAYHRRLLPEWFFKNGITVVVALQFLWLIIAVVYSKETIISIKFLAAKTWFLASFFIMPILVIKRKKDFVTAFAVVLIPLLISMCIIMYRHRMFGFGFLRINQAIGILWYNRVDYSAFMSMFFPLLLVAWPLTRKKRIYWRVLLLATMLFFLPCIYLTFARGAMLALVFAIAMGIAIKMRLANFAMPFFYGLIALTMVYMVRHNKYIDYRPNFEHTYTHFTFTDHMIATFRGEDMSSMERLYRWIAAVRMSNENPVTGVGPNAFYYYYKPYAVSSFRTYVSRNNEHSTTHNYFLLMLVEQGWPAMLLYAVLVALFFAKAQKVYHRFPKGEKFYRNVTLGIAMMFASCFITNFFSELLETHKIGAMFFLGLSLMVILDRKSREAVEHRLENEELSVSKVDLAG